MVPVHSTFRIFFYLKGKVVGKEAYNSLLTSLAFQLRCFVTEIEPLKPEDTMLIYGALGNFSLSGFELVLTRYVSTYIITYYLPSGTPPICFRYIYYLIGCPLLSLRS